MPSPWVFCHSFLLIVPFLSCDALPIADSALRYSSLPVKASNVSNSKPVFPGQSHPQMLKIGKPPVDVDDSENPSLLTSIPTFAPPAAIKERGGDQDYVGINVPNPIITVGIPSLKVIRQYISGQFRQKLRRSPTAQNMNPLPPASINAIQPHKAPITDSTINFVKDAGQNTVSDSAEQLSNKAGDNGTNSDIEDTSEKSADEPGDTIQDITSPGTAAETPLQSDAGVATVSGEPNPHSLSHSLGTLSHTQWQKEDNGKKRRKRRESGYQESVLKRVPDVNLADLFGDKSEEDFEVPTIWNGEVDAKDLDWYELQEFDDWLDTLAFVEQHKRKSSPSNFSLTPRPAINRTDTMTPGSSVSAPNGSSTSLSSTKSTTLAPPPKSLAKSLGLKPHSSIGNKTHRGDRRDETSHLGVKRGIARGFLKRLPAESIRISSLDDTLRSKREESEPEYIEPIGGPVYIDDEAFEEFKSQYPKFFGGGRAKKRTIQEGLLHSS